MSVSVLLLIGAVQAFFLAFVFLFKKGTGLVDKFLIAWLIVIALHLLFAYFGFSGTYRNYPLLIIYGFSLMLLEGPFLYLYTALATNQSKRLKLSYLTHTIPYFFFTIYVGLKVLNSNEDDQYNYLTGLFYDTKNIIVQIFGLLNHIHVIIYLVLSIILLKKHTKRLPHTHSFSEGVNLSWLKNLFLGIMIIAIIIIIGLLISDIFPVVSHYFKASLIYSVFALLPFYMSFYAIGQKIVYPYHVESQSRSKYKASGLAKENSDKIAQHLIGLMVSEKPFLNPKLTIKELSELIDVHPKQLSQVINENFNQNFFNFINGYRIKEFKQQITDSKNDNYTLIAIAYDCGFSTKSSFNSIFKKATGMTPSSYKLSLEEGIS